MEVWAAPRGGVDLLFPGEERRFEVCFRPLGEARAVFRVCVRGELGSEQNFEILFESRFPALRLVSLGSGENSRKLALASVGDLHEQFFELRSRAAASVRFAVAPAFVDFAREKLGGLVRFSPLVGSVGPGERVRVAVRFNFSPELVGRLLEYLDGLEGVGELKKLTGAES